MRESKPASCARFQFRTDLLLAVLFILGIFFMLAMTLITDFQNLYYAAGKWSETEEYLRDPEAYSPWTRLEDRIRSLDSYLVSHVYASTELGYLNSSFQYALGKRMVNTGGSQMLTLNSGHLFDIQSEVSLQSAFDNILAMKASVPAGTPFLFVYEHPTVYGDDEIPAGYDVLDYSEELAEEIRAWANAQGLSYIDSRDVLPFSGVARDDYLMYTDQHWSTRAGIIMTRSIASKLNELGGMGLKLSLLDDDNFESYTYPELFLGKYGQRIGTGNITPDDITVYWPKYPTRIRRYTDYLGKITDIEGEFRDSVIRSEYLQPDPGKTWNIKAYFDYGLTENYDHYTNENAADCTILLLKDSYSACIGSFLSLLADDVWAVDLRRRDHSLDEWIERTKPDAVVLAYSLQMLRQDDYAFQ